MVSSHDLSNGLTDSERRRFDAQANGAIFLFPNFARISGRTSPKQSGFTLILLE
jgi:hypothetical protein